MALKWSLSRHRMFRRCQRQYYFAHIAAWHNTNDPIRKEAFILKQVKEIPAFQGMVIHQGIKSFLVPPLQRHDCLQWDKIIEETIDLAQRQFIFSEARGYRIDGVTKGGTNGEYCALAEHERGERIPAETLDEVRHNIRRCFVNLSQMDELLEHMQRRRYYQTEFPIAVQFDGAIVQIVPDLVFSKGYGRPTVLDWKVEQDSTGSDHEFQVNLYAWVLCQNPKWGVQRPEHIEMIEVQLLQGKAHRSTCTSEVFEEVENFVYQSLYEIQALCGTHKYEEQVLADYQYANSSGTCNYCSFVTFCKELKR